MAKTPAKLHAFLVHEALVTVRTYRDGGEVKVDSARDVAPTLEGMHNDALVFGGATPTRPNPSALSVGLIRGRLGLQLHGFVQEPGHVVDRVAQFFQGDAADRPVDRVVPAAEQVGRHPHRDGKPLQAGGEVHQIRAVGVEILLQVAAQDAFRLLERVEGSKRPEMIFP